MFLHAGGEYECIFNKLCTKRVFFFFFLRSLLFCVCPFLVRFVLPSVHLISDQCCFLPFKLSPRKLCCSEVLFLYFRAVNMQAVVLHSQNARSQSKDSSKSIGFWIQPAKSDKAKN